MRKRIQKKYPNLLYHLSVTWEDSQRKAYTSPILVGNDEKLTLDNLEDVTHFWLRDGIEQRAKRVLGFKLLQTITL